MDGQHGTIRMLLSSASDLHQGPSKIPESFELTRLHFLSVCSFNQPVTVLTI